VGVPPERIHPTIWPTPVLHEGDGLAFDILGSRLQTLEPI